MVDDIRKDEVSERPEGEARTEAGEASQRSQSAEAAEKPAAQEASTQAGEGEPDLATQLAEAKAKANEYLDQLRRTAADFANYRKRVEREREEMGRFANALLITKLLPVLDDLERAMATLSPDLRHFTWTEGVWLIARKLEMVLEGEGLKPIEAVGKPFDPERHEAVIREETTAYPDGQVIAELQRGYELNGRVLRASLVKVAVAPKTPSEAAPSGPEAGSGASGAPAEGGTQVGAAPA